MRGHDEHISIGWQTTHSYIVVVVIATDTHEHFAVLSDNDLEIQFPNIDSSLCHLLLTTQDGIPVPIVVMIKNIFSHQPVPDKRNARGPSSSLNAVA